MHPPGSGVTDPCEPTDSDAGTGILVSWENSPVFYLPPPNSHCFVRMKIKRNVSGQKQVRSPGKDGLRSADSSWAQLEFYLTLTNPGNWGGLRKKKAKVPFSKRMRYEAVCEGK